ncbi:MAG: acetylglutamate kinase [Cardiobacteriaceae bacterium]|nr:acetylglutamate kinase [Cardiobacteriaceae bacterium]
MMLLVIKYGGNAIADDDAPKRFASAIKQAQDLGYQTVVVHGGGPQISHWLDKLSLESHFVNGQRYTDEASLQVVEMVLCGQVNKALCRALLAEGVPAVGVSGQDGAMLKARQNEALGLVGEICGVQSALLESLLHNGFTPVIAPLALDEATGQALNVNADLSAAAVAKALGAKKFILMTNVEGVLDGDKQRVSILKAEMAKAWIESGVIAGGMIPKVECALSALEGAEMAVILNGVEPETLVHYLRNPQGIGTQIIC